MGGAEAAAAIVARERRTVDAFRRSGATSPVETRSLAELGLYESWVVDRLMNRAVVRRAEPGTYYLDEESWQAFRRARGRRVIIAAVVILLIALGFLLKKVVRR